MRTMSSGVEERQGDGLAELKLMDSCGASCVACKSGRELAKSAGDDTRPATCWDFGTGGSVNYIDDRTLGSAHLG